MTITICQISCYKSKAQERNYSKEFIEAIIKRKMITRKALSKHVLSTRQSHCLRNMKAYL